MRIKVEIDDELARKAMALTQVKTKKGLLTTALTELTNIYMRRRLRQYKNSGIWEGNLDAMRGAI
jgi:Arc/MetJ family transcription regulator